MPRPNKSEERRESVLPLLAAEFARGGYRRATTATLARRCRLQETVLYRLWPDKKAMFLATIDHVFARSTAVWAELLRADARGPTPAEKILAHEAEHHGEWGLYRILFAGLSETEDLPRPRAGRLGVPRPGDDHEHRARAEPARRGEQEAPAEGGRETSSRGTLVNDRKEVLVCSGSG